MKRGESMSTDDWFDTVDWQLITAFMSLLELQKEQYFVAFYQRNFLNYENERINVT